jgi:hypothetical protein
MSRAEPTAWIGLSTLSATADAAFIEPRVRSDVSPRLASRHKFPDDIAIHRSFSNVKRADERQGLSPKPDCSPIVVDGAKMPASGVLLDQELNGATPRAGSAATIDWIDLEVEPNTSALGGGDGNNPCGPHVGTVLTIRSPARNGCYSAQNGGAPGRTFRARTKVKRRAALVDSRAAICFCMLFDASANSAN